MLKYNKNMNNEDSKNDKKNVKQNVDVSRILNALPRDDERRTLKDKLDEHMETVQKLNESADMKILNNPKGITLDDSVGNTLTASGDKDITSKYTTYSLDNDTMNWMLWLCLYNDSWVFKRAIDKPAQDMVRSGITINLKNENKKNNIYIEYDRMSFELIQLLQWGALFGGSVAVIMFDNFTDEDYAKPLNDKMKKKIKESKAIKLFVTDRWYGCAQSDKMVDDMINCDFGKPEFYDITLNSGDSIHVNHDYVLRYEHRVAPPFIKRGQLQGWGYAEGAHIFEVLEQDDELEGSIQSLINKSLIEVVKMSGMRGVFMGADEEGTEQLTKRLEMVGWARNYNSLTLLDKDDDYQMNTFSGISGLSDLLQQNMWKVSAALEMQGVLFGDLKQGFSNDEDALERYAETIMNRCESYYRVIVEKLLSILYIKYDIDEKVDFKFNSLMRQKQDKDAMESLKDYTAILSQLLADGVLTPKLYAQALQKYLSKGVVDLGLTDDVIEKIDEETNNELENINLDEEEESENESEKEGKDMQTGYDEPQPQNQQKKPVKLGVK